MQKIIDVSEFNGQINWSAAAAVIDGAILRAGYRGYGSSAGLMTDRRFQENLANAAGIPLGVYWLTQATTEAEAREEAEFLQQALHGTSLPLGVWLDSEAGSPQLIGRADRLDPASRTQFALAFLDRMRLFGHLTGLYCAADWFRHQIDGEQIRSAGHRIWLASVENVQPTVPWDGWQYTWKGRVSGVPGEVDISLFQSAQDSTPPYSDTTGHWAEQAIDRVRDEGLMTGRQNGSFAPDEPITRAEMAAVLDRLLDRLEP